MRSHTLIAALVVVGLLVGVRVLHGQSFCISEARFVSEEEALLVGIAHQKLGATYKYDQRNPENIARARQVLKDDPDCCKLLSGGEEEYYLNDYYGTLERLLGRASRIVFVKNRLIDPVDPDKGESVWIVPISSCGLRVTNTRSFIAGKNFSNRWYGD